MKKMLRKFVSIGLYVLLFFSAIGGYGYLFGKEKVATIPDYTNIQTIAENFVRAYMTVGPDGDERRREIAWIAPDAAKQVSSSAVGTQVVNLAKAQQPIFSGNKVVINVDTWTNAKKEVIKDEKKEIQETPRRFEVTVILAKDSDKGYYVTGLPLIKVKEAPTVQEQILDQATLSAREEMMPLIKSVIPSVISGDTQSISNFMSEDPVIHAYKGEFQFSKIEEVYVTASSTDRNGYIVDVNVEVKDPIVESVLDLRINMVLTKKDGKYYVKQVS